MTPTETNEYLGVLLRFGVFVLIALLGYFLFPMILLFFLGEGAPLVVATLSSFAAAAVSRLRRASGLRAPGGLAELSGWAGRRASRRNLILGVTAYEASGRRRGRSEPAQDPGSPPLTSFPSPTNPCVGPACSSSHSSLCLELRGRGNALSRTRIFPDSGAAPFGPFATILPMAVLFALAHSPNLISPGSR